VTRFPRKARSAPLLVGACAALLAGCGGADQPAVISQSRADQLERLLDEAERQFDDGNCDALTDTLGELGDEVSSIPSNVNADLRSTLDAETSELIDLAADCQPEETTTEAVPTTPTAPPTTAPPTTAPTQPEPTPTPEPPQEEEQPQQPPEDGGGDGGPGNGDSGDGGGDSGGSDGGSGLPGGGTGGNTDGGTGDGTGTGGGQPPAEPQNANATGAGA
jgi:hypothetical protein